MPGRGGGTGISGPLSVSRQKFASDSVYGSNVGGSYGWPQVRAGNNNTNRSGIASLSFKGRTFRFRTNPNYFQWGYKLNTKVENTYGGRVMQLLSTRIENFEMEFDAGNGRWDYMRSVLYFMRDILNGQRDGTTCTFEYTTRGYKFKGYLTNFPLQDRWDEVVRPFRISFAVQEDISGVLSTATLNAELRRLQADVGFRPSKYNQPGFSNTNSPLGFSSVWMAMDSLQDKLGGWTQSVDGYTDNPYGSDGSLNIVPSSTRRFNLGFNLPF